MPIVSDDAFIAGITKTARVATNTGQRAVAGVGMEPGQAGVALPDPARAGPPGGAGPLAGLLGRGVPPHAGLPRTAEGGPAPLPAGRSRRADVAATGRPELVTYDTSSENDLVWGVGLGCHGIVQVLLEPIPDAAPAWVANLANHLATRRPTPLAVVWRSADPALPLGTRLAAELPAPPADTTVFHETLTPPPSLLIFGAGDDAQPLAQLAATLGWHITVADPRAAFATARTPEACTSCGFMPRSWRSSMSSSCSADG